jgi:hypothetical protein
MRQEQTELIFKALGLLADAKGVKPLEPDHFKAYARYLEPYPGGLIVAAIDALAVDPNPFFPAVGQIVGEMARLLRTRVGEHGPPPILSNEEAWRAARATIASYQPQTRPQPRSGNPAVDEALRSLGGVRACQWHDAVGEGIVRRAFLEEYEQQVRRPGQLALALRGEARIPPLLPGLELPGYEVARLRAEAERRGVPPPAFALRIAAGQPERAAILDGRPAPAPHTLPPRLPVPLTEERRAALRAEAKERLAQLAARMRVPVAGDGAYARGPHDPGATVTRVVWKDGRASDVISVDAAAAAREARRDRLAARGSARKHHRPRPMAPERSGDGGDAARPGHSRAEAPEAKHTPV